MITFKQKLAKKDEIKIGIILSDLIDLYNDFYITSQNLRLAIKENLSLLFSNLSKGDKIFYDKSGVAIITGYSDKKELLKATGRAPRKYIKILAGDDLIADKLVQSIIWNTSIDLYVKIKKGNPLTKVFFKNRFFFHAGRGKEILLKRIFKERRNVRQRYNYKNQD